MEIVFALALVATALFAGDFAKNLPAYDLKALGLMFLALTIAVWIFIGSDVFKLERF